MVVVPLKVTVPELGVKVPEFNQLPETLKLPDDVGAVNTVPVPIVRLPFTSQAPESVAAVLMVPPERLRPEQVRELAPNLASPAPTLVNAPVLTVPEKVAFPELVMLNALLEVRVLLKA